MALLERLAILITADATGAIGELKKVADSTKKNLGDASAEGSNFSTNMTKAGAAMMGAGASLLAVGIKAANSTVELGREVMKLQRYTGMTAEEASKLRYAAKMSGVDVDSLATGLGRLSKNMDANIPAFGKLGVETRDSDNKLRSMADVLPEIAEKIKNMSNGAEKTSTILQLFGRSGMDLMPFLNRGKEGIEQLTEQAKKMGVVLSADNISAVKDNITAQRELGAAFTGIKTQIGLEMLPIMTGFTDVVKGIPGPVMEIIGPLTVFGGLGLTAAGGIGLLVGQLKNLAPALTAMTSWVMAASPATLVIIGLGAAIAAAAAVITIFGDSQRKDEASIQSFTDALKLQGVAMQEALSETIASKIENKGLSETLRNTGVSMTNMAKATTDGAGPMRKLADLMKHGFNPTQLADAMDGLSASQRQYAEEVLAAEKANQIDYKTRQELLYTMADLNEEYDTAKTSTDNLTAASEAMVPKLSTLEQAQIDAAAATRDHKKAADDLNSALRSAMDPFFAMTEATRRHQEAQENNTKATRDVFFAQLELNKARQSGDPKAIAEAEEKLTEANKKLEESYSAVGKSAMELQTAMNTLTGNIKDNANALPQAIAQVDSWRESGRLTTEQADKLKQQLRDAAAQALGFPSEIAMKVTLNTWEFWSNMDAVTKYLNNLTPEQRAIAAGTIAGARASGGRVGPGLAMGGRSSGNAYLVGELGPELFMPDTAGTVVSARQTAELVGAGVGGGNTAVYNINVSVSPTADKASIGKTLVEAISAFERRSGDGWRS